MFAALILEHEYATLNDLGDLAQSWLTLTGLMAVALLVLARLIAVGFSSRGAVALLGLVLALLVTLVAAVFLPAALGAQDALLLCGVELLGFAAAMEVALTLRGENRQPVHHGLIGRLRPAGPADEWRSRSFAFLLIVTVVGLAAAAVLSKVAWQHPTVAVVKDARGFPRQVEVADPKVGPFADGALLIGCGAALLALLWELLTDLPRFSGRRIWAVARLSIKEAIHRKALWTFVVLLVLFLFASWFIQAPRPEDQWRTYVSLVFFVMTALMLITASVLACFSLPNDIRLQTIHTIVTKPVHKFEIVIGRILGFSLLMTVILAVMAHLSLIYVYRGIDPAFREEVFRARQSVVGDLDFQELNEAGQLIPKVKSTNIGREWEYRSYIGGGTSQQARWRFRQIPAAVYELDRVPVEFGFDIFRTTKGGDETYKEGVSLQLTFINPAKWDYSPESYTAYRRAVEAEGRSKLGESERTAKFGYYELPSPITVVDYKTYMVTFPGSILKGDPARGIPDGQELIVQVSCRTPAQYVGMARRDLYLVPADANFYTNFLKATTGVWFLTVLVIALGVVFSTYLNALVSLLLTWLLMVCGLPQLREFIGVLAQPQTVDNPGGGPAEAMFRLLKHENLTKPLEQTTGVRILTTADQGFMYFFKIFLNLLPDLGQFDRTVYLAEGFDIPGGDLLTATLMLAGYLLPFLLVGYYLLNNREVAG